MKTQQAQLEKRLEQTGWRIIERQPGAPWWAKEVWTIESTWRPFGQRLWVTFILDPWPGSRGDFVSSVGVTPSPPTDEDRLMWSVGIRHGWASYLEELLARIDRLRESGPEED